MSAWRTRVIETFPDIERDLRGEFTSYNLFTQLLTRCREAHERNDDTELRKIYGFAEWCLHHQSNELSNAAGVSFYEHLGDYPITLQNLLYYISPEIFAEIADLLQWQMGSKKFAQLKSKYEEYHQTK